MDSKDFFEAKDGIKYNLSAGEYVTRITNRKTNQISHFLMHEEVDKKFWNFIKKSETSKLAWASRNAKGQQVAIVTFNIPEDKIAYKVVFDPKKRVSDGKEVENSIIKAFSSIKEGKWNVVKSLPKDVNEEFKRRVERLEFYLLPREHDESPNGIFR